MQPTPTNAKRHHFVAEMMSKRFTDPSGKLYCFNKQTPTMGVFCSGPVNIFVQNHLHTLRHEDGTKSVELETFFATLESEADQIIAKIVNSTRIGYLPNLTDEEKEIWDVFIYYQQKRVPDTHQKYLMDGEFNHVIEQVINKFESKYGPITEEDRRKFQSPEWRARVKQETRVRMLSSPPTHEIREILLRKGLCIGVIKKPNKSFIIGSAPVVRLTHTGRTHLADPTLELWLPIAHDTVISPAPKLKASERIVCFQDHHVRHLNEAIFRQSTMIAGCSPNLIASLPGIRSSQTSKKRLCDNEFFGNLARELEADSQRAIFHSAPF